MERWTHQDLWITIKWKHYRICKIFCPLKKMESDNMFKHVQQRIDGPPTIRSLNLYCSGPRDVLLISAPPSPPKPFAIKNEVPWEAIHQWWSAHIMNIKCMIKYSWHGESIRVRNWDHMHVTVTSSTLYFVLEQAVCLCFSKTSQIFNSITKFSPLKKKSQEIKF